MQQLEAFTASVAVDPHGAQGRRGSNASTDTGDNHDANPTRLQLCCSKWRAVVRFIESAANSELYEAYQLVVTVLGVISFLYYSYNVTFQYTATSAEYVFNESSIGATDFCTCCVWGCGCRG